MSPTPKFTLCTIQIIGKILSTVLGGQFNINKLICTISISDFNLTQRSGVCVMSKYLILCQSIILSTKFTMSISKIFKPNVVCVLSEIDRKLIDQNFYSIAGVMPNGWDLEMLGEVKHSSVGICDDAPSTARSSCLLFSFL